MTMPSSKPKKAWRLPHPPIVEMVLDIDCDLGANFDLSTAVSAVRDAYLSFYPVETKHYAENVVIEPREDMTQVSTMARAIRAYRFHREDHTQIVQVRDSGFSFNRLAPYQGFDALLPEIECAWRIYRERMKPLAIRRTSLRYLNRIVVPREGEFVDLDLYFKTGPRLPKKGLMSTGFLLQNSAFDAATKSEVVTVLASQGNPERPECAFLLDIAVTSNEPIAIDEADILLRRTLATLRKLKNDVFRNTVTRPCLQLFD